jgi:hypothetical protein
MFVHVFIQCNSCFIWSHLLQGFFCFVGAILLQGVWEALSPHGAAWATATTIAATGLLCGSFFCADRLHHTDKTINDHGEEDGE